MFADLNPAAVANATANVEKHGFGDRATVVETDLFANVGSTKFDVIIFNAPFLYAATEVSRMTMGTDSGLFRPGVPPPESFFDEGYKLLARFYSQVREHLAPAGFIQFSFSNLGNGEALNKILDANRFKRDHVLTETTGTFEWQVLHVRPID